MLKNYKVEYFMDDEYQGNSIMRKLSWTGLMMCLNMRKNAKIIKPGCEKEWNNVTISEIKIGGQEITVAEGMEVF